ncbi:type II secretion system F family protein [Trichlorobacter ammonificans]|uniref:Type II secretion system protein n=1 Tax=Trichlorobacter ammonificans TaxID=2916410 RepID=A0ABM9D9D5_9BACT|nr:type II secretion system F family protein [Trichlorobacter ammonificans]CAH2031334.1 Type II secretion system protein [Trichlorobacter ammonificans]
MALFTCTIGLADGSIQTRELEGDDAARLRQRLTEMGLQVFSVRRKRFSLLYETSGRRLATRDLLTFNQELLVLLKAGMPMLQALDTLHEQWPGERRFSAILGRIRDEVTAGGTLSGALEQHGSVFPQLYIASVRAGERTGDLVVTIRRYLQFLKRSDQVRRNVVSALVYPVILVVVACLAVALLLVYVVPTFSRIYADAGSQLPLVTRLLIGFTTGLRAWLPLVAVVAVCMAFSLRYWARTAAGRYRVDHWKLRIPLVGELVRSHAVSAFSRTMGTLLGSGIPLVESLRNAAGTLHNRFMEARLLETVRLVEEGSTLAAALERSRIMPLLALRMLGVGEATGALEELFTDIADYLESEVEERLRLLTTAVEPAIMILMGAVVGGIIIAMYLPIFKIAGTVG